MLVCFKVNLGSNDADLIGLDFKLCVAGAQLEVSEKAGGWLLAKGCATEVVIEAVAKTAEIQGVPEDNKPAQSAGRNKSTSQTSKES